MVGILSTYLQSACVSLLVTIFGALAAHAEARDPIRVLTMSDPFAIVMRDHIDVFEALIGQPLELELVGYEALRQQLLLNAFEEHSRFELIAVDAAWAQEVAAAELVLPLDSLLTSQNVVTKTYLQPALKSANVDEVTIGLPVQPHAELLFYDRHHLSEQNLAPPVTTDDVLNVATQLHGQREGLSGICWNARHGAPLGQTMLHLLAAFGGAPLDETGQPTLDTMAMRSAIRYAKNLLDVSPPDILDMAWDERIEAFATGRCALTYGWTGRSLLLERSGLDLESGRIGVAPAPHAPGAKPVSPLGTWLLSIPSNLSEDRTQSAFDALLKLTSIDANRLYVEHGVGTLLHTSLIDAPSVAARNPAVAMMGQLEKQGALQGWMRPGIDAFQGLTEILGSQVHGVLTGVRSIDDAAAGSQASFAALLSE